MPSRRHRAVGRSALDAVRGATWEAPLDPDPSRDSLVLTCTRQVAGWRKTMRKRSGGSAVRPNRVTPARSTASASVTRDGLGVMQDYGEAIPWFR